MPTLRPLALTLLAAASLSAADFRGGLQLGLAFPTGDWKTLVDTSVGAQLDVFGVWSIHGGHSVRGKLMGTASSQKVQGNDHSVTVSALGGEYLYYVDGSPDRGPYVGGGVFLGQAQRRLELGNWARTSTKNGAVLTAAAGYQFNRHWSVEANYQRMRVTDDGQSVTLPAFAVVAGYAF